ncbi:Arylsulfotransferase ASST [Fusarium albosuccineum]|uniref:Arylsulfotransferase ASST n=1 Tax=Fusarium albosuccineum TaxID=1237068 RepID=A0A8H4LD88_9HYPO|nr:Arylsulfotransferase ASST [Fusarium albosuccineum]
MKSLTATLTLTAALLNAANADSQYRSRPDLAPPRLNITIPATDKVSPGYILVGPYPGFDGVRAGPEQPAAYIFTNDGDLVWSSLGYYAGWVANFQAVKYQGKPVLQAFQGALDSFHGHGYGTPMLLDDHYRPVALVEALNHRLISIHEFKIVNEKTALVEIYQPTAIDLSRYGGSDDENWIADGIFQEFDIATGELIFEGHTLDFASPADSVIPLRSGRAFTGVNASDAWDYFHINSVDKNEAGEYLVSGRHMSALYKVNGSDGSLIWQLGGKKSTFSLPNGLDFGYQHDARFLDRSEDGEIETISFFDNSARSDRQRAGGVDLLHPHSRARIVQLNNTDNTAKEIKTFIPPDLLSVWSQGNVQVLESGNVFVNWGQAGAVTEFKLDGTPIFHAYLDSGALAPGVQSYRGFRYEWTGHSRETPALVPYAEDGETTLYVSWNGDTVTHAWRFYYQCASDNDGGAFETIKLGEVKRSSFETSLSLSSPSLQCKGKGSGFFAHAVDAVGKILSSSAVVGVKDLKRPAAPFALKEQPKRQKTLFGYWEL